jgi:hypothetical protein
LWQTICGFLSSLPTTTAPPGWGIVPGRRKSLSDSPPLSQRTWQTVTNWLGPRSTNDGNGRIWSIVVPDRIPACRADIRHLERRVLDTGYQPMRLLPRPHGFQSQGNAHLISLEEQWLGTEDHRSFAQVRTPGQRRDRAVKSLARGARRIGTSEGAFTIISFGRKRIATASLTTLLRTGKLLQASHV